jgi:hypothetical protein
MPEYRKYMHMSYLKFKGIYTLYTTEYVAKIRISFHLSSTYIIALAVRTHDALKFHYILKTSGEKGMPEVIYMNLS